MKSLNASLKALFAAAILTLSIFSQTDKPVEDWKKYKVPNTRISFSMPKLPVVTNQMDRGGECLQIAGNRYVAYAGQTIYEFSWETKDERPRPEYCDEDEDDAFSPNDYTKRIANLRATDFSESETTLAGTSGKIFKREMDSYVETKWLCWLDNSLIEMTVLRRKDLSPAGGDRFANSLGIKEVSALDIGEGSKAPNSDTNSKSSSTATIEPVTDPLVVRFKPRPGYTDLARTNNIAGSVVLKVTFLADGGIGEIHPVKGLEHGLTEQTIAAVRRIIFLPARSKGVPVTVTKQLEYHFSIY